MKIYREDIESRFRDLADQVLLQRYMSGDLTDLAREVARNEMQTRGLQIPEDQHSVALEEPAESAGQSGDLVRISGNLTYAEAQVLCSFLDFEGIPAVLADAHMATAHQFLSFATGGVRVLIHENNIARANEIVAAFKRGEYQIDDDFDVGEQ